MTQNDVDLTIPDRFNEDCAVFGIMPIAALAMWVKILVRIQAIWTSWPGLPRLVITAIPPQGSLRLEIFSLLSPSWHLAALRWRIMVI